uniref:Uncharacterized protein n=1 Tax=Plectus sambesii TaxID=2011161 RepID=A0A914WMF0_9BILA
MARQTGNALFLLLCTFVFCHVNAQTDMTTAGAPEVNTASTGAPEFNTGTSAGSIVSSAVTGGAPMSTTTAAPAAPSCSTTNCPKECACTPAKIWLDIVLVVDTSSSMTVEGLIQTQAFLAGIIGGLTVSQAPGGNTRVAIVSFASATNVGKYLTDLNSTADAVNAIYNIAYDGSDEVNIEAAFKTAGDVIRTSDQRPNARNVIILVTSSNQKGAPNDPNPIANQLKHEGNAIMTITVTQSSTSTPPSIDYSTPGYNFSNTQANFTNAIALALCDANCFCPPLWFQFTSGFIGTSSFKRYGECLYPGDVPAPWDAAQRACTYRNGHLMDAFNADKHSFAQSLAMQYFSSAGPPVYWIGLNNQTGPWLWDGGNGNSTASASDDYMNWMSGYPDAGTGSCVANVKFTGFILKWRNLPCSSAFTDAHNYFCQIKSCDTNTYCP